MKSITIAEHAGFCFGVKRATDRLEESLANARTGERIYTLGHLIHNETYNESLHRRGVDAIDPEQIETLAASADANHPVTLLVRAHGCPKQTEQLLVRLATENPYFRWLDCTCPFVKKIHRIAEENSGEDQFFVLMGTANHPEVVGIMSYFDGDKFVAADENELEMILLQEAKDILHKKNTCYGGANDLEFVELAKKSKKYEKALYKCRNF